MACKKGICRCFIDGIIALSLATLAWGASSQPTVTSAKIGNKELKSATGVTIIKSDLTLSGEIIIKGAAAGGDQQVKKVELSLDGGKTWKEARGGESWQYSFAPVSGGSYKLVIRVINAAGVLSDTKSFKMVSFTYRPITLSELIQRQADELAKAYIARDLERYMALISKDYHRYPEGWSNVRRTIANDFKSRQNITLRLTVNQVFDLEGAIMADIYWRLTYAGLAKPEEGYMEIQLDPVNQLKILVQEKDRYFGAP